MIYLQILALVAQMATRFAYKKPSSTPSTSSFLIFARHFSFKSFL